MAIGSLLESADLGNKQGINTGRGKSRLTVVHMGNTNAIVKTIIYI